MRKDIKEMLSRWDSGESVWSIEMGGLGPGYEQAIQILIVELIRDNAEKKLPKPSKSDGWGDDTVHRINNDCLGFSGAQVGAAKHVAYKFLRDGVEKTKKSIPGDRLIQISKEWLFQKHILQDFRTHRSLAQDCK